MTRSHFDQELEHLHTDLIQMGAMIEEAINGAITVLIQQNLSLARDIVAHDRQIDDMEKVIETGCLRLLWHEQPVAKDLRAVTTAIKIITDMERIGDQAADIADIALHRHIADIALLSPCILQMADQAADMVKKSILAFTGRDLSLAHEIITRDDVVDGLFEQVKAELIGLVTHDAAQANAVIDALMVAKYWERIGDHAVNICEWIEFDETGIRKNTDTQRRSHGTADLLCGR